jgi:hypothetical protein|tara:strand:- start:32 stop:232 length:201 start_codon:yes stop_codon:yes gene_type:complete
MSIVYDEENKDQLTICLSEIFTEDELSLIVGSLNSFFPKLIDLESKERIYHTDLLQRLIDKIEEAS